MIHAVAGNVSSDALASELHWALKLADRIERDGGDDADARRAIAVEAHGTRRALVAAGTGCVRVETVSVRPTIISGIAVDLERPTIDSEPAIIRTVLGPQPAVITRLPATSLGLIAAIPTANVHDYLTEHPLAPLDEVGPWVWQNVLGEAVSDAPVAVQEIPALEPGIRCGIGALTTVTIDVPDAQELEVLRGQLEKLIQQVEVPTGS